MSDAVRWIVLVALVALLVGLLVWARGDTHRRGDEVGAAPDVTQRVATR